MKIILKHAHTDARTHACTHARTHARTHAHTHTHIHTHTRTHARTHIHNQKSKLNEPGRVLTPVRTYWGTFGSSLRSQLDRLPRGLVLSSGGYSWPSHLGFSLGRNSALCRLVFVVLLKELLCTEGLACRAWQGLRCKFSFFFSPPFLFQVSIHIAVLRLLPNFKFYNFISFLFLIHPA